MKAKHATSCPELVSTSPRPLSTSIASRCWSARGLAATLSIGAAIVSQLSPAFLGSRAEATTYYWDAASDTWATASDWSLDPSGVPAGSAVPTATDIAVFNGSTINGPETISLNAATSIGGITFNNTGTTTIQSSSTTSQTLTLGASGLTLNAGAGAVTIGNATNLTPVALSAVQTWLNNSSNALTLVNGLSMGANALTLSGSGGFAIGGTVTGTVATGSVALTINNGAVVSLTSGSNTFTGDIAIDGANSTLVYSGGTATTTSQLGQGPGTAFKQVLLTNGGTFAVTTSDFNDNTVTTTNKGAGVVFNFGTGGGTLNVASGRLLTIDDGTGVGTGTGNAELQGAGQLTKTGAGTLSLGNGTTQSFATFTGAIVVNAGTLQLGGGVNPLGATTAGTTIAAGADFNLNGTTTAAAEPLTISGGGVGGTSNVIRNSSATAASFAGPITLAAASTLGATSAGNLTLTGGVTGAFDLMLNTASTGGTIFSTGSINNNGAIINVGTGTSSATINSVIGANVTSITQNSPTSALVLSGANTFSYGVLVKAGTLTGTNTATALGTGTVTLGDATVNKAATLNGNFGGTIANPIVLTSGVNAPLTISTTNTVAGQVFSGGVTGSNNLVLSANGTQSLTFSGGLINNAGTVTNAGTGSGSAIIASGFGVNVTNIVQNSATSALVLQGTNSYTGTATATNGVLEFFGPSAMIGYPLPAAGSIVAASGGTIALGIGAAAGQFTASDVVSILNGSLPITFAPTGSYLGFDTSNAVGGVLTMNVSIADPAGVSLGVNKVGTNSLILSGTNTYSGATLVTSGVLSAADGVGLPSGSSLNLNGIGATATFLPVATVFERPSGSGAGQMAITGGTSGFTSQNTGQTVDFGSAGTPDALSWGSASFNPSNLVLNDTGATNTLSFLNPIDFNGAARTVTVNAAGAGTAVTLSGLLTGTGAGGLTKAGAGILNVTNGANTYAGGTTISAGTLSFNGGGATSGTMPLPAASAVILGGATLQVLNDSAGTLAYGNTVNVTTTSGVINVGNNGGTTSGSTVAFGTLNAPTTAAPTPTTTTFSGNNGYNVSFANLTLPGTTGATTTLIANTNVSINGNVTNRMTGFASTNFDTVALQGTATGSTINGIISDGTNGSITAGGYTPVTKSGTGTWTLAGANTYTGNTTISAGTLRLTGSLGGTLVNVNGSGTLTASGNVTIGTGIATLQATQGTVVVAGGTTAAAQGTLSLVDNSINTLTIKGNNFATPAAQILTLGGTTAGATSILNFEIGNNSTDQINLSTGNSTKLLVQLGGATVNLVPLAGTTLANGTYNLITYGSGTFTGGFNLGTAVPAGRFYSLVNTATAEQLIVANGAGVANAYWSGSQSSIWNTNPNGTTNFTTDYAGTTNSALPSIDTNVFFTGSTAANFSTTLGQNLAINSLSFTGSGSPAATNSVTIGGANTLTLQAAAGFTDQNGTSYGAGTGIIVQAGAAAETISASVNLAASQIWENDSTNTLTVSGIVGGAAGLTKTGNGSLVLSGANTFSNGLVIDAGTVSATTSSNALGGAAGTVTLGNPAGGSSNATLLGDGRTFANPIILGTTTGTLTLGNSAATGTAVFSGGITGTNNLVLSDSGAGALTISTGALNITGSITSNGSSTGLTTISSVIGANVTSITQNNPSLTSSLVLQGANTAYSGPIIVNAGRLDGQNTAATNVIQAFGTGLITLNGGVLEPRANGSGSAQMIVTGNGTVGNNITVAGNSTIDWQRISGTNTGNGVVFNNLNIGSNQLNVTTNATSQNYAVNFAGSTSITGGATFNPANIALNFLGAVADGGNSVTVSGSGATRLANTAAGAGANTVTGTWTVNGGNLVGFAPANGAVIPASNSLGTATLALTGTNPVVHFAPVLGTSLASGTTAGLQDKSFTGVASLAATNFLGPVQPVTTGTGGQNATGIQTVSQINIATGATATTTSHQYTGLLNITTAGMYNFSILSDDGVNLVIDGGPFIGGSTNATYTGAVYLSAGLHTFSDRWNNNGGNGAQVVSYQGPDTGGALSVIPASAFVSALSTADLNASFGNNVTLAAGTNGTVDIASNTTLGAFTMTGTGSTTLNVTGSGDNTTATFSGATTLSDSLTVNTSTANLVLNGPINGSGGGILTKAGPGILTLSGSINLTQIVDPVGTVALTSNSTLNGTAVLVNGGTFDLGGSSQSIGNFTLTTGTIVNGTLTGTSLFKQGAGVLNLGAAVTGVANVTVNQGLQSTTSNPATNSTINLNFAGTGAPSSNLINSTAALNLGGTATSLLGGGQLTLTGASAANSQTFLSTLVDGGASAVVLAPGAGGSMALNLGTLSRNIGGTVDITLPTGTQSSTNGVTASSPNAGTLVTSSVGTLFATVGGDNWAAYSTVNPGNIVGANVAGAAGASLYTNASNAATFSGDADITAAFTANNGATVDSIRFNTGALTLTLTGTNTITSGGILFGSGTSGVSKITGGTIIPGSGQELVIVSNKPNTAEALASILADGGNGPTTVTYRGNPSGAATGSLFDIQANNSYTGPTFITNGRVGVQTVAVTSPFGTGSNATVYVDGSQDGQFFLAQNVTIANPFVIVGNGLNESGTRRGALRLDSTTAITPTLSGPITLVGDASIGNGAAITGAGTAIISGNIQTSNAQGATSFVLTKVGTGDLRLTGAANGQSATAINAGMLQIGTDNVLGTYNGSPSPLSFTGSSTLQFLNSGITLGANRALTLAAGTATFDPSPVAGSASTTIDSIITGPGALTKLYATQATKTNPLVLTGVNTFTGNVTITSGWLTITNSSSLGTGTKTVTIATNASSDSLHLDPSLGATPGTPIDLPSTISFTTSNDGLNANNLLNPNEGTITNESGNNIIRGNITMTSGGGGTALSSKAGSITFTGNLTPNITARSLYLKGDGDGAISGVIADGSTIQMPVTRTAGSGTWTLSGANTYGGNTFVQNGTLKIGNANALGYNPVTAGGGTISANTQVSSGATLDLNGVSGVSEQIVLNGSGIGGNGALINSNAGSTAVISNSISSVGITTAAGATSTTVTISGGGGSGATATANLGLTAASFTINGGTQTYSAAPTVTITGGGGTGATATAVLTGGLVTGVTITGVGTNFSTAPTIAFSGGTVSVAGTAPTGTGNATNFTLNNITITNQGSGYTSAPTFTDGTAVIAAPAVGGIQLASDSTVGGAGNIVVNGSITGGFGLTKVGNGTLTLASSGNTYSGMTSVNAGTVVVTGSISGSLFTSVSGTGTLSGTGSVGQTSASSGGTIAPGINGLGTLTVVGGLGLDAASTFSIALGGTSAGQFGQVNAGNISLDNTTGSLLHLSLANGYVPAQGAFFVIGLTTNESGFFANTVTDTNPAFFGGAAFPSITVNGHEFAVSYNSTGTTFFNGGAGGGTNIALLAIPEPNTAATLLGGLGSLIGLQRFRRRRSA